MRKLPAALLLLTAFAAHAEPPTFDRAKRLLERGHSAAAAGDTLSALGYYRDAISAAPRRDDGYIALGELYLALGEPARALEVLQAGGRWTVHAEALWMALFATHQALHEDAKALDALRHLRRLEPESRRCLSALAELTEAHGAFIEALAARRGLLTLLERDRAQAEAAREQRARVRALELLLGGAELARSKSQCGAGSAVERALASCNQHGLFVRTGAVDPTP
jgi:tetratricopeptide (TPR) repeat protein